MRIPSSPNRVHFGPSGAADEHAQRFELDIEHLELMRDGVPIELRPQAARALVVLIENAGRLVTFEELKQTLWADQHLEGRNSLHQCIRDLRRALTDDARAPRFVGTVARLGYRFIGSCPSRPRGSERQRERPRPTMAFIAGFAAALLLPALFLVLCGAFAG